MRLMRSKEINKLCKKHYEHGLSMGYEAGFKSCKGERIDLRFLEWKHLRLMEEAEAILRGKL
jgi:hypothetical protein